MLFNSLKFLIFFPVVVFVYFLLPHKWRWAWLLGTSCVFYMEFVPVYILILGVTIVIDYFAGIMIEQSTKWKRPLLIMSLVANLGILAVFKYYNFLTENINLLLHTSGVTDSIPLLSILLPIGLSFHTFQAMSYTIEVYRGNQKAERHFGIYALYVMFFPQLVAGPIERPQNMIHQFREKHFFIPQNVLDGLRQMLWGFFKKVVIADRIANYVDVVFGNYENCHYLNIIIAALLFTIQIYADFSGYSDIAIGAARILGINLMINFNRPFISQNITEFWRRWHISLSSWFNDYLFQPLMIANRNLGKAGTALSLLTTFFFAGIWHGAGWAFIVYGLLHGAALIFEFYTKKLRGSFSKKIPSGIYITASQILTFAFVSIALIFFRAPTVEIAFNMIKKIFSFNTENSFYWQYEGGLLTFNEFSWAVLSVCILILFIIEKKAGTNLLAFKNYPKYDLIFGMILLTIIMTCGIFNQTSFIYFQF